MLRQEGRAKLYDILSKRFSRDELRTLCFNLNIPYEEFPENRSGLARELIVYCERRSHLQELIQTGRRMRPDIDWDAVLSPPPPPPPPPGVWRCPQEDQNAQYVGSITSRRYHSLECGWGRRIADDNRLCFASHEAARDFGYLPCKICRPPS